MASSAWHVRRYCAHHSTLGRRDALARDVAAGYLSCARKRSQDPATNDIPSDANQTARTREYSRELRLLEYAIGGSWANVTRRSNSSHEEGALGVTAGGHFLVSGL